MNSFVEKHKISSEMEQKIVSYINKVVKINPTGVIDWYGMTDVLCMEKVEEGDFLEKIREMLQKIGSNAQHVYFVVQTDDAHPPLRTRLEDYLAHLAEILHHDTVFLPEDGSHIVHYDFYGNLWGKTALAEAERFLSANKF